MKGLAQYYQVLFIFGGEPTIFREFEELLSLADLHPHLRVGLVTNASNLHKYMEQIKRVNWLFIAVSLDAASAGMYKEMRNSRQWEQVNQNILLLSELKKDRKFEFNIAMTVNSKNCREIYDFMKLSDSYGATPKISLVSNPDGMSFYAKYMWFNKKKRDHILSQIERSLRDFNHTADATGLKVLKRQFEGGDLSFYSTQLKSIIKTVTPLSIKKLIKRSMMSLNIK
jgi:MoaA/NifB/PqqE/SkfB family radical SAM enzyme